MPTFLKLICEALDEAIEDWIQFSALDKIFIPLFLLAALVLLCAAVIA